VKTTFKGRAVKAVFGGLTILAADVVRRYQWRVKRYGTPGTEGEATHQNGRPSFVDAVTALLTLEDAKALVKLGNEKSFHSWQHPLLDPILGRLENLELPASPGLDGYFAATFQIVEHNEPKQNYAVITLSPQGAKGITDAAFAGLTADMDGLADIPTGQDGATFTDAFDDFSGSFDDLGSAFDAVDDGTGSWKDLSRTLDMVTSAADAFIDATRAVVDTIEGTADTLIRDTLTVVDAARTAVDSLQAAADKVVTFVTTAPGDLYGMMLEAGLEITDASLAAIMESTGIVDPLAILPGVSVTIPRKVA